jgi:hypothetical protein
MATTRTWKSLVFLGLLSLALLSSVLTVFAEAPADPPRADPEPNPIDDLFTDPGLGDEDSTCNRAPWDQRTLDELQCLQQPELLPVFW